LTTELRVWDGSGKVLFAVTDTRADTRVALPRYLKLSRDGTRLAYSVSDAVGAADKGKLVSRLRVWDVATHKELLRRDGERGAHTVWDFSPDGRRLATTFALRTAPKDMTSRASVWDLADGTEALGMDALQFSALAFSPDGRRMAGHVAGPTGGEPGGYLRIWDATTGRVLRSWKDDLGFTSHLVFNANGTLLAVAGGIPYREPEGVQVRSAADGKVLSTLTGLRGLVVQMAFSPDGRLVTLSYLQGARREEMKVWDADGGRELLSLPTKGLRNLSNFAFSRDGRRLFHVAPALRRRDAEVRVWDATPLPEGAGGR
jgi:WD40 repeat protein